MVNLLLILAVIGVSMWLIWTYVPRPASVILNLVLGIIILVLCLRLAGVHV